MTSAKGFGRPARPAAVLPLVTIREGGTRMENAIRNYNFRKDCDPLTQIKRHIGYILLEEFRATSDEQLLSTKIWVKKNRKKTYTLFSQHWVMDHRITSSGSAEISSRNNQVMGILEKICKAVSYQKKKNICGF